MTEKYITSFNLEDVEQEKYDVVIIGSGIAGVFTALELPDELRILILTKEKVEISNSVLAQGGIAVSLDKGDSPTLHFNDTLYAGAGLCNEETVWILVNEAAENIGKLCKYGVDFDKKNSTELALTREAAHSKNRIIHSGDSTGKEVCDKLVIEANKKKNIVIKEKLFAIDFLTQDNKCVGVLAYDGVKSKLKAFLSSNVICATGGYGQLYSRTSNPEVATGDGIAMAYRAGAVLSDLEFIQFHPTVLYHEHNMSFLISEAVRGEGAILRDVSGNTFMEKYHEMKELAPRDIVARAIFSEMAKANSEFVYLDITHKGKDYLQKRFPMIYSTCMEYGIDMAKDWIPVAPAEHYCMGGIKTDKNGMTCIEGLYSCGEAACTGIHGANRLASNSLLEGIVFGERIALEITKRKNATIAIKNIRNEIIHNENIKDSLKIKKKIQKIMTKYVGIVRDEKSLKIALKEILDVKKNIPTQVQLCYKDVELVNMITVAELMIKSAIERKESRGAHYRLDFPTVDEKWEKSIERKR